MPHMIGRSAIAAIALCAGCRAGSEATPRAVPAAAIEAPRAGPSAAPAPAPSAEPEAEASAVAEEPAAVAAGPTPDPGPGLFRCGQAVCKAGVEVCAPRQACGEDWPAKACVAKNELSARTFDSQNPSATCQDECFGWFDTKECDGPGDCKQGEVCCYSRQRIIGPCDDGEDGHIDEYACKPAIAGRTPCHTAEICSAKEPTCARPGSSCAVDEATGIGRCAVPRRAKQEDLSRVFECERGRDCAPDESCFTGPGGHWCGLNATSWAGDEVALCQDASDCVGFCRGRKDAVCYPDGERRFCECRPACQRSQDCKSSDYCARLSLNRYGGAMLPLEPFCNLAQRRCDCRELPP
jgi:hypothetical protein